MSIVKLIGIAILGLVTAGILKEVKPSLAIFASVATGLIILFSLLNEFTSLVTEFKRIADIANVDGTLITTIIKIIGIGYLGEFTANIAEDYGFPSIGKKVLFGAKIIIALISIPIITNIIETIGSILS